MYSSNRRLNTNRLLSLVIHRSVAHVLTRDCPLVPQLDDMLERSPTQQANCSKDEAPDDDLVFVAVSLEARGNDVFFLCLFAEINPLTEAKRFCTLGA